MKKLSAALLLLPALAMAADCDGAPAPSTFGEAEVAPLFTTPELSRASADLEAGRYAEAARVFLLLPPARGALRRGDCARRGRGVEGRR